MRIANADKLKDHFEHVVMVKLFTVPEILTIIDTFTMNMPITDDDKLYPLDQEAIIVPSLDEGKWEPDNLGFTCNKCGWTATVPEDVIGEYHFCPSCGAWMRNSLDDKF